MNATSSVRMRLTSFAVNNPLLILLIVMVICVQVLTGAQLNPANLRGVGLDAAVLAIVAAPAAMLIISGYIDFSVASTLALSGVVAASVIKSTGSTPMAVIAALLIGAAVGAANSFLTTILGFSPFITTLGMLIAVRGLAQLASPLPLSGFGGEFSFIGVGTLATIPLAIWIAALVLALSAIFLTMTPAGRHVYALGVSREAAYLSGVKVRAIPFALYTVSGMCAGLAGVITVARLNSAPAGQLGSGYELTVITAVLLGGVALQGGAGNIFGVMVGVLFLGMLNNALVLLNIPNFWQNVASGLALVAAIGIAVLTQKARQALIAAEAKRAGSVDLPNATNTPNAPAPAPAARDNASTLV